MSASARQIEGVIDMEMDAINSISKPKIPNIYSYVLKSSQLNEFLKSNNIKICTSLDYWLPQIIGTIFEVHYWQPNDKIPYPRLYIRAGALRKTDIQAARILMSDEVLPKFYSWYEEIQKEQVHSRYFLASRPYFNAIYADNAVKIVYM